MNYGYVIFLLNLERFPQYGIICFPFLFSVSTSCIMWPNLHYKSTHPVNEHFTIGSMIWFSRRTNNHISSRVCFVGGCAVLPFIILIIGILSLSYASCLFYTLSVHLIFQHVIIEVEMGTKLVTRHEQSVAHLTEILLSVRWQIQYIAWHNNVYDLKLYRTGR